MDAGVGGAASLVTLIQLAATTIKYIKNVADASTQKRQLLVTLIQTRGLLVTLSELTAEVDDEDWSYTIQSLSADHGPLHTFRDLLEQIAKKAGLTETESHSRGGSIAASLQRLLWPFDRAGVEEMIASLEQLKSLFSLAVANDHLRLSMAIRNEIQDMHSDLAAMAIDARRRAVVSLTSEQELIVRSLSFGTLRTEVDGDEIMRTRVSTEWFLSHKEFRHWRYATSSPASSTLVLMGPPGTGKSTICQAVNFFLKVWNQSNIDTCVAYVAFNYLDSEKTTVSSVLSDIVQQVVLELPFLMEHVSALGITGGPLSFSRSLDLLCRIRRELRQFYLILDGLDECEAVGNEVVNRLKAIQPPLNMLIAGRTSPGLVRVAQDSTSFRMPEMNSGSILAEVTKSWLEQRPLIRHYLDNDSSNIASAALLIAEKSTGVYIYAKCFIEYLARAESKTTFDGRLQSPPLSLEELYKMLLGDMLHQPVDLITIATGS